MIKERFTARSVVQSPRESPIPVPRYFKHENNNLLVSQLELQIGSQTSAKRPRLVFSRCSSSSSSIPRDSPNVTKIHHRKLNNFALLAGTVSSDTRNSKLDFANYSTDQSHTVQIITQDTTPQASQQFLFFDKHGQ